MPEPASLVSTDVPTPNYLSDIESVAEAKTPCRSPKRSVIFRRPSPGREFITHYGGTAEGGDGAVTEHVCDYCGESFATYNELGAT